MPGKGDVFRMEGRNGSVETHPDSQRFPVMSTQEEGHKAQGAGVLRFYSLAVPIALPRDTGWRFPFNVDPQAQGSALLSSRASC